MIATKRVLWGYFLITITPDMFNDLKVCGGFIWGKIYIDTVKEFVTYMAELKKVNRKEVRKTHLFFCLVFFAYCGILTLYSS